MKSNEKKLRGGFTVIELLVVIAIIGILSAIILVALGNARKNAKIAKIHSDMVQMRNQIELGHNTNPEYYSDIGVYGPTWSVGLFPNGLNVNNPRMAASIGWPNLSSLVKDISAQNGGECIVASQAGGFPWTKNNTIQDEGYFVSNNVTCPQTGIMIFVVPGKYIFNSDGFYYATSYSIYVRTDSSSNKGYACFDSANNFVKTGTGSLTVPLTDVPVDSNGNPVCK